MKEVLCRLWMSAMLVAFPFLVAYGRTRNAWAMPRVSVACVRESPGHASELGSQVLMGMPLRVLGEDGDWMRVETPEGYKGYVIANSLVLMSDDDVDTWRRSRRVVVASVDQTYVYDNAGCDTPLGRVSDVVDGCVLELMSPVDSIGTDGFVGVRLPDGRIGYMKSADVQDADQWSRDACRKRSVIDFARMLLGTPYLWGGTSTKSMDCSGLTKIAYFSQGIILPRNASQQAAIGTAVDIADMAGFSTGDLLMFGSRATGRVNHVGMYIGDGKFIHCSGRVQINSLIQSDSDYMDLELLSVRHLGGRDLELLSVKNHPWYFSKVVD